MITTYLTNSSPIQLNFKIYLNPNMWGILLVFTEVQTLTDTDSLAHRGVTLDHKFKMFSHPDALICI
jgi:hypothetical protein